MITIDRALLREDGTPEETLLLEIIKKHESNRVRRLDPLHEIYIRNHDIVSRRRLSGLPNNKLVHDYPNYIATMASGYLVGKPVQYKAPEGQDEAYEVIDNAMDTAETDCVDSELAIDCSVYGKGVELCYADTQARPMSSSVSPLDAFVVYDDTVEHKPLFGVMIVDKTDRFLKKTGEKITLYTTAETVHHERISKEAPKFASREPHHFDGVPMTEYWNNKAETGDFEPVVSLIDAYDELQSDRVNDKQQFTDAIMVLKGVGSLGVDDTEETTTEEGEDGEVAEADAEYKATLTPSQRLRQTRTMFLPGDGADAGYITKPDAESGNELLRKSLADDIHKFSFVPNLTDEKFAGVSSGVAMRFKLLGLEQITGVKERWFRDGLRARLRLFANFLSKKGAAAVDIDKVQITFSRSLPVNELEIAQTVQTYKGIVPDELLLGQVPFVEDADKALVTLQKESAKKLEESRMLFATQPLKEKPDAEKDKKP